MLDLMKSLLGITDNQQDTILQFTIDTITELVKGYCRISEIPSNMDNLIVKMAIDLYRREGYGSVSAPKEIQSETQGSRSVTYMSSPANTEDILTDYQKLLKPYVNRKGRVPSEII